MRALILVAGAALAVSACSSNEAANNTMNVDENMATENMDMNVDANMTMNADANAMNVDANAATNVDANATANTTTNNAM
ncbi:MAG TPA: hypothetical protein VJM15_09380 [Sphingomicrobium sp.]|nr:hypothetical protein [Sphingomicrobium sp.]